MELLLFSYCFKYGLFYMENIIDFGLTNLGGVGWMNERVVWYYLVINEVMIITVIKYVTI
jgi:hypothetical protein